MSSKIRTTSSFRSLSNVLIAVNFYLQIEHSAPSFSTAKLWIKKVGLSQLNLPKEKADDWILILDESIGIGQEKVLVILGIRESKIDFTRPLKIQDMSPITVKSREKWSGEDISRELEEVRSKLGGIKYAVTDAGSTLKNGLRKSNIEHVYDITHATAIYLERIYKNDNCFKEFTYQAGQMRFKLCSSKYAHLISPNQRSKSRFLNIDILTKWSMKALHAIENNQVSAEELEQLAWLNAKKIFIEELNIIMSIVESISKLLKNEGLSRRTKAQSMKLLRRCKQGRLKQFKEYMTAYLEENSKLLDKSAKKLLCCSDIIESSFGKYKNELSKNPMCGITDLVLIIPALTIDLTVESINAAIDSCTVKSIEEWKEKNICNSLMAKRKAVFSQ